MARGLEHLVCQPGRSGWQLQQSRSETSSSTTNIRSTDRQAYRLPHSSRLRFGNR